jgi:hypothetical protein
MLRGTGAGANIATGESPADRAAFLLNIATGEESVNDCEVQCFGIATLKTQVYEHRQSRKSGLIPLLVRL